MEYGLLTRTERDPWAISSGLCHVHTRATIDVDDNPNGFMEFQSGIVSIGHCKIVKQWSGSVLDECWLSPCEGIPTGKGPPASLGKDHLQVGSFRFDG